MSTDLYGIRVLRLDPDAREVDLRVFVVYYDVNRKTHQPLPQDWSFFLRALWKKADSRHYEGALGEEIDVAQILDEGWVDANAWRFIASVEMLESRNHPVADWSIYSDFYTDQGGRWPMEGDLVQADYRVTVTAPEYLEHLGEGMGWGSTAYETVAYEAAPVDRRPGERLPDLQTPTVDLRPFEGQAREAGTASQVAFSPCGNFLAVSSQESEVVVYDVGAGFEERWRGCVPGRPLFPHMGFDEAGRLWLRAYDGEGVWDVEGGERLDVAAPQGRVRCGGEEWLHFTEEPFVTVVTRSGEALRQVDSDLEGVEVVGVFPDGRRAALAGFGTHIEVRDLRTGELEQALDVGGRVVAVAVSADARLLAFKLMASGGVGRARIVRVEDGTVACRLVDRTFSIYGFAWSPDGQWLATKQLYTATLGGGRVTVHRVLAGPDADGEPRT